MEELNVRFAVNGHKNVVLEGRVVQGMKVFNLDGDQFFVDEAIDLISNVTDGPTREFSRLADKLVELAILNDYNDEGWLTAGPNFEKFSKRIRAM